MTASRGYWEGMAMKVRMVCVRAPRIFRGLLRIFARKG
jgi:hypothetical protein